MNSEAHGVVEFCGERTAAHCEKMSASRNTVVAGVGLAVLSAAALFSIAKLLIAGMEKMCY